MSPSGSPWSAAITIRNRGHSFSKFPIILVVIVYPFGALGMWTVSFAAFSAYLALWLIALLYLARRCCVRFDDSGITVRNVYRTRKLNWHEVSRFTDGDGDDGTGCRPLADPGAADGKSDIWLIATLASAGSWLCRDKPGTRKLAANA